MQHPSFLVNVHAKYAFCFFFFAADASWELGYPANVGRVPAIVGRGLRGLNPRVLVEVPLNQASHHR